MSPSFRSLLVMVLHPFGLPKLLLLPKRFRIQLDVAPLLPGSETFLVQMSLNQVSLNPKPGPNFSPNLIATDTVLVGNPDGWSSMKGAEDG
jgi:hypothetical protein